MATQLHTPAAQRPLDWHASLSGPPDLCSAGRLGLEGVLLRRWQGTAPDMEQPPLDHHYLTQHLVGAKRVTRSAGHRSVTAEVSCGAVSFTAAGRAYNWSTQGPIAFAHLYISPRLIGRVALQDFDRDARSIDFKDHVGRGSPLLGALMGGLISELECPSAASRLVLGSLLNSIMVQLFTESSTLGRGDLAARHMIAPARLRRVIDFIEANLALDIDLADLASVAGSSRFHFSRAFRAATGMPPYRFVIHRRVNLAKTLLLDSELSIEDIATGCGFHSRGQFAAMFRRILGVSPARFRRDQ